MKILGLMTGTSMDGLDCIYVDININKDYNLKYDILDYNTYPFTKSIRKLIYNSIGDLKSKISNHCNEELGKFFLDKTNFFLNNNKVDLISMHGQTISHINNVKSIQIGTPKYLYQHFKIPVYYDFRSYDILLGGSGAPLIPFLDWLLFKNSKIDIITLNLGGIANITYLPKQCSRDDVIGFDTGPGMCLIDEYMNFKFNLEFDNKGNTASKGKINKELLLYLLKDKFVNKSYPKSTSRENFGILYIKKTINKFPNVNKYDFLRTLVSYTATSIFCNVEKLISNKSNFNLILSGSGTKNLLLLDDIKKIFSKNNVCTINDYNIDVDIKEALLMAIMGATKYKNIDNNMPSVTGAKKYASYGSMYE